MTQHDTRSRFLAKLMRPVAADAEATWAFVVLPQEASAPLPRRGRTSVIGTINGHGFQALLEPDGRLSHWLRIDRALIERAGAEIGEIAEFEIAPMVPEPEPELPSDLSDALLSAPEARAVWDATTTIARVDWIHWIVSAKQAKTRAQRVRDACEMLASGKRRVCCFDPSGYYSKALRAPKSEK